MHCLKEDSVLGREGFSVRAASPGASDPSTLDWALKLDTYELPLDMKSGPLLANQAPRRLARVPGPPGRVALVHTAYLPEDTVGRSHSFISQILLLPKLGTATGRRRLGSSDWQTDEYTRGETKSLPTLDHLPHGSLHRRGGPCRRSSQAVPPRPTRAWRGRSIPAGSSRTPRPGGAGSGPRCTGSCAPIEPNTPRTRVCILAEPGAVALLVYAIARLLPPQIAGAIPFSTYEPPHTSLREKQGGPGHRQLRAQRPRTRRHETLQTPRLRRGHVPRRLRPRPVGRAVLAAGRAAEARRRRGLDGRGRDPRALVARRADRAGSVAGVLAEAIRARPLVVALGNGTLAAEGLLELRRNRFGEGILRDEQYRRPAWEAVRKVWSQPAIRTEFRELLGDHLDELMQEVRGRAESGPAGAWREGWQALKDVIPTERRVDEFSKLLVAMERTGASLPAAEREVLLGEWCQAAPAKATLPPRLHWLLNAQRR